MTARPPFGSLLLRVVLVAICSVGAWYSITIARAESLFRQSSPSSVSAAVRLVPYNSRYLVGMASLQPEHSSELVQKAVLLNPFDVRSWVQLGLDAEFQRQDLASAEKYYLHATEVNRMFYVRSNMANFYYRYQRREEFFHWVSLALGMAYADPSFFFTQIWDASNNGRFNQRLIGDRVPILRAYSDFLIKTKRFDEAEAALVSSVQRMAVERLSRAVLPPVPYTRDPLARAFMGNALDQMLAAGRLGSATRMWTLLQANGWWAEPAPSAGKPITNGKFGSASLGHGFDWVFNPQAGVEIDQYPQSNRLRINFTGTEPEVCRILQQHIVLKPNGRYRLSWNADSEGIPKNAGLQWRVFPVTDRGPAIATELISPDLLSESGEGHWDFTAPAEPLNLLTLQYDRQLGTVRVDGEVSLRSVALTLLPQ
jgi:hypothetical protein